MAAPAITINDFNSLFQPGQLPDLGLIIDKALSNVSLETLATIPDASIKAIGPNITDIKNAAIAPALVVAGSPYLADIKKYTDIYATIPTFISGFVKPAITLPAAASGATGTLAINNAVYGPILTYLKTTIHDFDSIIMFKLVQQNADTTDPAKLTALTTLIQKYITYTNNLITTFKLDNGNLNTKYYQIVGSIEKTTSKIDITLPSSKSIDITAYVALVEPYIYPAGSPAPPRATPDPVITETAKSINTSMNNIITLNKADSFNNPKVIKSLKTIPAIISNLGKYILDTVNLPILSGVGAKDFIVGNLAPIFPIPAATKTLFDSLTKDTFKANLIKPTTGIIQFLTLNYTSNFVQNIKKMVDRTKNSTGQIKLIASSSVTKMLSSYFILLNTLINIFNIKLADDLAIAPHIDIINNLTSMPNLKILTSPQPLTGGSKKPGRKATGRKATGRKATGRKATGRKATGRKATRRKATR